LSHEGNINYIFMCMWSKFCIDFQISWILVTHSC